ncbi:MAG TPA: hypothetical protein VLU94_01285, partial [Candidatus Nitrosotalea sp.]|nr:hypothetical protein [Candidatus Nitrosotalea sp.]
VIQDGGITRTQVWHYPSRAECLACHTASGGFALGFNTPQLNRDTDYGSGAESQIAALSRVGYFTTPATNLHTLRSLAASTNASVSLEYRVRSYLAANCSQCHQPGGPTVALWDARITTPLSQTSLIDGRLNNDAGDTNNRVVVPGSLLHSMLLQRISVRGPRQMPPLDSTVLDTNAISLVSAWITNDLPSYQTFAQWQDANFGSTNSPDALPTADPDADGAINSLEYLTGTNPNLAGDGWSIALQPTSTGVELSFLQTANRGFEIEWTDGLEAPVQWQPLDVTGNEPFFSAASFTKTVLENITSDPARYYRVRVYEP